MTSASEDQRDQEIKSAIFGAGDTDQPSIQQGIGPTYLAYLIGPIALVAVLLLMHFGAIVREPPLVWIGVFIAVPLSSLLADALRRAHPSMITTHLRIATHAAAVAVVIYLTGWGPVLWGAFAFIALENVSYDGSRSWTDRKSTRLNSSHRH